MGYRAYDFVTYAVALLGLPLLPLLWLTRHGERLGERLGRLPDTVRRLRNPIWIHAASVGEVLSAEPLVAALREQDATRPLLVTTTSLTGRAAAMSHLRPDAAMLLPIDVHAIILGAMQAIQPRCLIIVETELWPGLLRAAARQRVPVCVVSGCLSERSARLYARLPRLVDAMLAQVQVFAMQTPEDARRLLDLGAAPARVHVTGSLKYARSATAVTAVSTPWGDWLRGRRIVVAASTHAGEEELVLDACAPLWAAYEDLLLVVAPRRPERFAGVAGEIHCRGLVMQRRSQLQTAPAAATRVLLLDSVGELSAVLPWAEAVFVGGTVATVGGHNVLEPATFAKPVAFGPHTENVATAAADLLAAGAGRRVQTAAELAAFYREMLARPDTAQAMGGRGQALVQARVDVVQRTLALLAPYLEEKPA